MKKNVIITVSLVLVLLLCGGGLLAWCKIVVPKNKYDDAMSLMKACEYRKAADIFADLGDYGDAPERLAQCNVFLDCERKYLDAAAAFDAGNYEEAANLFDELYSYKDGKDRALESRYMLADRYTANGQALKGKDIFESLGGYKDSADRVNEYYYREAMKHLDAKRYDDAENAFEKLGDYKDSKDMVLECTYRKAKELMAKGSALAKSLFEEIKDYKDSAELLIKIEKQPVYEKAVKLMNDGNYTQARELFLTIEDYSDSREKIKQLDGLIVESKYLWGIAYANAGSHTLAISAFREVGDYKDSKERLNAELEKVYNEVLIYYLKRKDYSGALARLEILEDYKDSPQKKTELLDLVYGKATEALEKKQYAEAISLFTVAGDHKDAPQMLEDAKYKEALHYLEYELFDTAYKKFEALGDYKDSKAMLTETRYRQAVHLAEGTGNSGAEEATVLFEELGDYKDSKAWLDKLALLEESYRNALKLLDEGKYLEAYEAFEALGHYCDSYKKKLAAATKLGEQCYDEGKYEEAIGYLKSAAYFDDAARELQGKCYEKWGEELYGAGEIREALKKLEHYDGSAEAKALALKISNSPEFWQIAEEGERITFGKYLYSVDSEPHPIEWLIYKKEDGRLWLVSDKILDCRQYSSDTDDTSWAASDLRAWLNGEFCDIAFSNEEKTLLRDRVAGGVTDEVSLMTRSEAIYAKFDPISDGAPTSYAISNGCHRGNVSWTSLVANWFLLEGKGWRNDSQFWENLYPSSTGGVRPVICIEVK